MRKKKAPRRKTGILEYRGYTLHVTQSARISYSLSVNAYGQIFLRMPLVYSELFLHKFLESRMGWLEEKTTKCAERMATVQSEKLTPQDELRLKLDLKNKLDEALAYYAKLLNVTYGNVRIHKMRGRWGSCTTKGNLNFNLALGLAPAEVIEAIAAHELCHRKYMNHGKEFHALLRSVCPDYDARHAYLKQNGTTMIMRIMD